MVSIKPWRHAYITILQTAAISDNLAGSMTLLF